MLRYIVLGLLARQDSYGYELQAAGERLFGGTWAINVGQVYATLARLERDGSVEGRVVEQESRPDRRVFSVTSAGLDVLLRWLGEPVLGVQLKQDLFGKLLLHCLLDAGDPMLFIWQQRQRYLETLAHFSRLRTDKEVEPITALLVDGAIYQIEADLKWLDECEARAGDIKRRSA